MMSNTIHSKPPAPAEPVASEPAIPVGLTPEAELAAAVTLSALSEADAARQMRHAEQEAQHALERRRVAQMREAADERYSAAMWNAASGAIGGLASVGVGIVGLRASVAGEQAAGEAWSSILGGAGKLLETSATAFGSVAEDAARRKDIVAEQTGNLAQQRQEAAQDAAADTQRALDRADRMLGRVEQLERARQEARNTAIRG